MKKKLKKIIPIIIVLIIIGVIIAKVVTKKPQMVMEQQFLEVEKGDIENNIYISGTITTDEERNINYNGTGTVQDVKVKIGDNVVKGQLLAILDNETLNNSLEVKELQLQNSKEQLRQLELNGDLSLKNEVLTAERVYFDAKKKYEKNQQLLEEGAISQAEYDEVELTFKGAEDSYNNAKERLENSILDSQIKVQKNAIKSSELDIARLRDDIKKTNIKSTIDGNVVEINVKSGEAFKESESMFKIVNLDKLYVQTYISEGQINKVKLGQKVEITGMSIKGKTIEGEVYYIAPGTKKIDGKKQAFVEVRIKYDEAKSGLRPDFSVNLKVNTEKKEQVKKVKFEGINTDVDGKKYVMVQRNNEPVREDIEVGIEGDVYVEIISDNIQVGDQIIVSK
jgi:multidrug resistance efflux pump